MLAPDRSPLAGLAEVDETEITCRSKNDPVSGGEGRSHHGKILVVGAVGIEDNGAGPGRIRLNQVPDHSASSLHAFLAANLATGATAKTDEWSGYPGAAGLIHDPYVVCKMAAHVILPQVHRIFSNLKVWALGVYRGLRRKHLQSYLHEFVFRFNRRRTRRAAFRSLLTIAAAHRPLTYNTGSAGISLDTISNSLAWKSRRLVVLSFVMYVVAFFSGTRIFDGVVGKLGPQSMSMFINRY